MDGVLYMSSQSVRSVRPSILRLSRLSAVVGDSFTRRTHPYRLTDMTCARTPQVQDIVELYSVAVPAVVVVVVDHVPQSVNLSDGVRNWSK